MYTSRTEANGMNMTTAQQQGLELEGISLSLGKGGFTIDGLDLQAKEGEFLSLVGPSGCGKSTTLRMVAGLLSPDSGRIRIGGADVTDVAPHRRRIGFVFQDHALWSHMTVRRHIEFALKYAKVPRAQVRSRVDEVLGLVHLDRHADHYPFELSGGQRQRVSIARALAPAPAMLLLDEPLSNLDRHLREEMQREIRAIQQRLGTTALYVTHDRNEALSMSDRIAVMQSGRLQQIDTPSRIYEAPTNEYVARLLGPINAIPSTIISITTHLGVRLPNGAGISLPADACGQPPSAPDSQMTMLVRPDNIMLCDVADERHHVAGTVASTMYSGSSSEYMVEVEGMPTALKVVEREHIREPGSRVGLRFDKVSFAEEVDDVA
ncbi:ABC transporter ATP-binding protein [Brevibacterium sp.]|uniref:ABC transporter ATP-binding protein n=1 Tax=Brevibacterium sp. TaxID=1701 RepID=UPI00281153D6|nr:ABC transporter ATP-binding protein [Brevibacterium sp.]